MKQRLLIAGWTVVILGAGYFAGVWTERHACKVPPPPQQQLLGELSDKKAADSASKPAPPPNAAKLAAEIAKLRPEIETFRARMEEIDREMDRDIAAILRPDQKELFQKNVDTWAAYRAKEDAEADNPTPLTEQEINDLRQKPLYKMLGIVVVPLRLEWYTRDLKLDDAQRDRLREIFKARRQKFIDLVDSSPPPSLTLSRLAPMAQRLVTPSKADEKPSEKK